MTYHIYKMDKNGVCYGYATTNDADVVGLIVHKWVEEGFLTRTVKEE